MGEGCYYFSADKGYIIDSFDAATTFCEADGGNLAVTETRDETLALGERYLRENSECTNNAIPQATGLTASRL